MVSHQLTDLPDDAGEMPEFRVRHEEMRGEGTGNLAAAAAVQARGVIAQSISSDHPGARARSPPRTSEPCWKPAGW